METIADRLELVRERVRAAAVAAGRAPDSVKLLAVSKGHPSAALREAYAAGQRDFGENYAQELARKAEELADLPELRLHMIGHLQRNKAKLVARHASAVHTVDSEALALELDKRAAESTLPPARRLSVEDARLPVLVEVSIAGEAQKSGVDPERLPALLDRLDQCPHLRTLGLMCVPPLEDPSESRRYFEKLRLLRDQLGGAPRLPELSMGMTADFELAIAEQSTIVRVGTAIFGARAARARVEEP